MKQSSMSYQNILIKAF